MILYNVILGNQNLAPDPWTHIEDPHGNHFIAKDDLHQRIRIDAKVDSSIYPPIGELTPEWSSANMKCYKLLPKTRWVNNNRNMNPLLLPQREGEEDKELIILYLTVSNNYAICSFKCNYPILQTYHKKDTLQGCAIVLNNTDITDHKIISINAYDRKKDQYIQFGVSFMDDDMTKLTVTKKMIKNQVTINNMNELVHKYKSRYMGFKILTNKDQLLTLTYLTNDKFKPTIESITKDINKPNIIVLNSDKMEDEKYLTEITEMLLTKFTDGRIRAITQCGINLPLDIVRKLKLLYVFNYDVKNSTLSCRKSN